MSFTLFKIISNKLIFFFPPYFILNFYHLAESVVYYWWVLFCFVVLFFPDSVIGELFMQHSKSLFNFVKQAHRQVNLIYLTFLHKKELEEN